MPALDEVEQPEAVTPQPPGQSVVDRRWGARLAVVASGLLAVNLVMLVLVGSVVLDEGIPDAGDYARDTVSETARAYSTMAFLGMFYVPALLGVAIGFGFFASRSTYRWARTAGFACVILPVALFVGNAFMGTLWWSFGS